jgi:hypothetical protein
MRQPKQRSKHKMPATTSNYKRGTIIVFTGAIGQTFNGYRFSSKEIKKGDVGKIASRKKNGWLRVSLLGDNAGRVISVRSGDGGMLIACDSNGDMSAHWEAQPEIIELSSDEDEFGMQPAVVNEMVKVEPPFAPLPTTEPFEREMYIDKHDLTKKIENALNAIIENREREPMLALAKLFAVESGAEFWKTRAGGEACAFPVV